MQLKRELIINVPKNKVWQILGPNFADAYRWASAVDHSEASFDGVGPDGAPAPGRICETSFGPIKENILEYDEERHRIAYDAIGEKMPGFVKRMVGRWTVDEAGPSKTAVGITLTVEIAPPFNILMGPLMRLQLGWILTKTVQELRYFAEHGTPHPRKIKANLKAQVQAA